VAVPSAAPSTAAANPCGDRRGLSWLWESTYGKVAIAAAVGVVMYNVAPVRDLVKLEKIKTKTRLQEHHHLLMRKT
jgi:hypothetical protein